MASASACAPSSASFGRLLAGDRRFQRRVQQLRHLRSLEGRQFRHRVVELVAGNERLREALGVFLHRLGFPDVRTRRHVAGRDRPLGGLFGSGRPLDEVGCGLKFLVGRPLQQVEIAAAGGGAVLRQTRQEADTEIEGRVGAHVGQVARGGPDHRRLAFEERLRRATPVENARSHHAVLGRQRHKRFERADGCVGIEVHVLAGVIGQQSAIAGDDAGPEPGREARGRDVHAPLGDVAAVVLDSQLLAHLDHFSPVGGTLFRVETGLCKGFLVPVEHRRRALERDAPGLALGLAVGHECRVEAADPVLLFFICDVVVPSDDHVFVDEGVHVGRQRDDQLRRVAAAHGGDRLGRGVGIGAGVDRVDLHAFIVGHVFLGQRLDRVRRGAADGDREIELEIDGVGMGGKHCQRRSRQKYVKQFHEEGPSWVGKL
jgi:hypothetical protein